MSICGSRTSSGERAFFLGSHVNLQLRIPHLMYAGSMKIASAPGMGSEPPENACPYRTSLQLIRHLVGQEPKLARGIGRG